MIISRIGNYIWISISIPVVHPPGEQRAAWIHCTGFQNVARLFKCQEVIIMPKKRKSKTGQIAKLKENAFVCLDLQRVRTGIQNS